MKIKTLKVGDFFILNTAIAAGNEYVGKKFRVLGISGGRCTFDLSGGSTPGTYVMNNTTEYTYIPLSIKLKLCEVSF